MVAAAAGCADDDAEFDDLDGFETQEPAPAPAPPPADTAIMMEDTLMLDTGMEGSGTPPR